jgi:FkbM family methyltransferase
VKHSVKRRLVAFTIRNLGLAHIFRKLGPIASSVHFRENARIRLDEIRNLLVVTRVRNKLVRMGDSLDGGYVMQIPTSRNVYCLSIGVGSNISFDLALSEFVSSIHLYDHTVTSLPEISKSNMSFVKKGLGPTANRDFVSLSDCIDKFPKDSDLILKMDIEGAEWDVLNNLESATLQRFQQIIIELHGIHQFNNDLQFSKITSSLEKLAANHQIVNLHANNWAGFEIIANVPVPDVLEVTYLRKNLLEVFENADPNALNLNWPCNPDSDEISLSF